MAQITEVAQLYLIDDKDENIVFPSLRTLGFIVVGGYCPDVYITGLQIGSIIAFALITETVFQWPGMGLLFLQAIQFADIPVMSTYLILIAFFFVVINLIVDLLYHVVDPRLRIGKAVIAG